MIKIDKLKLIEKNNFVIKEIYNRYRKSKYVEWKKPTSYIEFPYTEDEFLINWTERIEEVKKMWLDWKTMYREKFFDKDAWAYVYKKVTNDWAFFKSTEKVFDIVIELENEIELEYYKFPDWNVKEFAKDVTITWVSASKIKSMIASLLDEEPKLVEWKDKLWNKALVPEYDYEDKMKDLLKWKFVRFKTSWVWIDTKYIFSKWDKFDLIDDIFQSTEVKPSKAKEKLWKSDINIEDIPF